MNSTWVDIIQYPGDSKTLFTYSSYFNILSNKYGYQIKISSFTQIVANFIF